MRQIVLDTETTGIGHESGHRIIEIGCVELIERRLTGELFHCYLNPERPVDEGAFRVHGLSNHFLQDKPRFVEVMPDFLKFIDRAELIIHNAAFDLGFLNAELSRVKPKQIIEERCSIIDTLVLARQLHPGQRNSLDALCKRYYIDNSKRSKHGALLDAEILARVYLALTGGQVQLFDEEQMSNESSLLDNQTASVLSTISPVQYANDDELQKHKEFVQRLIQQSGVNHWQDA